MKKMISMLIAIALILSLALTPVFAEDTELAEVGTYDLDAYDYEIGNFEGVTYDGSVFAKIYVYDTWTMDETAPAGFGIWMKENPEIQLENEYDSQTMNLVCKIVNPEEYDGVTTVEEMLTYLEGMGIGYEGEIVTVNGIRTLVFNSEGKYNMGACYELPEGLLMIIVTGITNEELENEAVTTICSLITEE